MALVRQWQPDGYCNNPHNANRDWYLIGRTATRTVASCPHSHEAKPVRVCAQTARALCARSPYVQAGSKPLCIPCVMLVTLKSLKLGTVVSDERTERQQPS